FVPSGQPNRSSLATDTPTVPMPWRSQKARSSSSARSNVEIALTHARGCIRASAEREPAGNAAAAVELEVDAGHELRLAAREVHRGVRDISRDAEPGEVHARVPRAPLVGDAGIAPVVEHVAGADRVAADAVGRVVDRDRARQ